MDGTQMREPAEVQQLTEEYARLLLLRGLDEHRRFRQLAKQLQAQGEGR